MYMRLDIENLKLQLLSYTNRLVLNMTFASHLFFYGGGGCYFWGLGALYSTPSQQ